MDKSEKQLSYLMETLASRLREELSNLYLSGRRLAPPEMRKAMPKTDRVSAFADQSRIRLLRLARNMEEAAALMKDDAFVRESCDIVELVSEICEGSADLAKYLGVELTFSCMEAEHLCAVSPEHIRQLVYHLVSNALKNTPKDGHVRVVLRFPRARGEILLSVEDNGRGIPVEEIPALFDWVWNPDREEESVPRSIGMGLAICKRIAEGHGGTLSVTSKPGAGSRFTLCIPDETSKTLRFRQADVDSPNGGIHPSLLMLSDALPWEAFKITNQL